MLEIKDSMIVVVNFEAMSKIKVHYYLCRPVSNIESY